MGTLSLTYPWEIQDMYTVRPGSHEHIMTLEYTGIESFFPRKPAQSATDVARCYKQMIKPSINTEF